jgi:trimeric autotransporter adhesin
VKTYSSCIARFVLTIVAAGLAVAFAAGCTPETVTSTATIIPTTTVYSTLPERSPSPLPSTSPPTLKALRVIPPVPYILLVGFDIPFVATGVYSDNSFKDISTEVNWKSSDPAVATIDKMGKLTGKSPGTTIVSASVGSIVSQEAVVTVVIPGQRT